MKIASWNVNSVKARLPAVVAWLRQAAPDAVALQEIKTVAEAFPREDFEDLGYNCIVCGQKTYNGVALLTKRPPEDVVCALPGDESDAQARYVEALIPGDRGFVRLAGLYAPNGNPVGGDKFAYKLAWMERLQARASALLANEEPLALIGDYNVIREDRDCYDPAAWTQDALFHPEARAALRRLLNLGLTDAFRARQPTAEQYTFWDYQGGAWAKNLGLRIDLILLSAQGLDRMKDCGIDREVRAGDRPSDHAPVWCELDV